MVAYTQNELLSATEISKQFGYSDGYDLVYIKLSDVGGGFVW